MGSEAEGTDSRTRQLQNEKPPLLLAGDGHERKLSRLRYHLDSAVPGGPLGSLDLSGQRRFFVQTPHLTRYLLRRLYFTAF